jgi:hypothetical protein
MASKRRSFLCAFDIPCANFAVVSPLAELQAVLKAISFPHLLNLAMSAELGKQGRLSWCWGHCESYGY